MMRVLESLQARYLLKKFPHFCHLCREKIEDIPYFVKEGRTKSKRERSTYYHIECARRVNLL